MKKKIGKRKIGKRQMRIGKTGKRKRNEVSSGSNL